MGAGGVTGGVTGTQLGRAGGGLGAGDDALTSRPQLAILLVMALSEHLPLADVKKRLSEVIDTLEREHGRVVVTKHGRPAAVMINVDDLESLEETLEILSNPALMAAIRAGEDDAAEGRTERVSRDEMLARVARK